jgi:hypothetical protein
MAAPQFFPSCFCCLALSNFLTLPCPPAQCLPFNQDFSGKLLDVVRASSFYQMVNWRWPLLSLDELLQEAGFDKTQSILALRKELVGFTPIEVAL